MNSCGRQRILNGFVLAPLIWALGFSTSNAADWPMWRNNVSRGGHTGEQLPDKLHLQWSRQLPRTRMAWPNESRLHFDASYEPIVVGRQMFVGSPNDGSIAAFDTRTGKENWRFFTDGPVRLAAVGTKDRVYFGSDDGYLYCVNTQTGSLQWKVRGSTDDRAEYLHLGNARLVSYWPVRGGPVLHDGVVYFGAGIWPTLGVFVRAVDAETGKVLWTNSNSHAIAGLRIDHNYQIEGGISPQGHLLVSQDMVIVPNGRSMPARLDRKTGKLKYFVQGYRNGDSRVSVSGDIALVGENGVVSLKDGREISSQWAAAGKDAPKGWDSRVNLFEGPLFPYKFQPGLDYRSVLHEGVAYGMHDGIVYAYDLKSAAISVYDKEFQKRTLKPARWDAPLLWKLAPPFNKTKTPTRSIINAGDRLYGHAGRYLLAIDLPSAKLQSPRVAWAKTLDDEPSSLLAADGRLFVVTSNGHVHCFGTDTGKPLVHELKRENGDATEDASTPLAKIYLNATRETAGYAVVAGLSDGRLVDELLRNSQFNILVIDDNRDRVNQLRRRLVVEGTYGDRVQAIVGDPTKLLLPPYLATLLISERPEELDLHSETTIRHLYSVLRPYGGAACFILPSDRITAVAKVLSIAALDQAVIESSPQMLILRRDGALSNTADWTHETGDAARSFFSRDERVKAPLAVLWYGDGSDHGFYKRKDYGHGVKPQVAGGRLFALQIATNTLHAVDAYTGRLLWVRKVGVSARYASTAEAVYVAAGRKCEFLDPSTGKTQRETTIDVEKPDDVPVSVSDIRVDGDIVLLGIRFNNENAISKGRWNSKMLVAIDRENNEQLWTREAEHRYNTAAIAVADSTVFCVDSHSPADIGVMSRRGVNVDKLPSTILALNSRTGKIRWQTIKSDKPATLTTLHFMGMRTQDDWLAYSTEHNLLLTGKANNTYALDAKTGKEVWHKPMRGQQPLILGTTTFINQSGHTYDIKNGKLINGTALFHRGGCNYAVGNKNLLFLRSSCAAYVDIKSRKQYDLRNLRSGCSNSLVAADGLLNVPCFSVGCICNYPIQTSFAMIHMPEAADWHGTEPLKLKVPPVSGDER